jgi:photosystem II stability/assembly factor-like uncharacterized protein
MGEMQAPHIKLELPTGSPAAVWSVTSDGKVRRSTDGGKTSEQIEVSHEVKFRVVAALGNDVWAGGAGGTLFHSTDRGVTWSRVSLSVEGNTIAETITGIQLRDAQHLTVTAASGSQWASDDGGQHWHNQP